MVAGFAGPASVDTASPLIAGFGFDSRGAHGRAPRSRGFEVAADRFPAHPSGLLDPGQRPAQTAECEDLLLYRVIQDVAHRGAGSLLARVNVSAGAQLIAGFAVSTDCRLWLSTEGFS